MLEQLLFITISVILFGAIFFKMIKKNETEYIVILVLEALGIMLDGAGIIFNLKLNFIIKSIIYFVAIVLPILLLILEYKNIDIINSIKMLQVKLYMSSGDYKKAKDVLIAMVEKSQNNYVAHKTLAVIYEKEGGLRKAIDEYVMCIDINKKDYDSYYKVSLLLTELEKKDEAIQMLANLLDKKPDYYNASITLGDLLLENGNYKEAANIFLDALKFQPVSFELFYELGIAYTMLNDFQSAKEYYEKAAQINSLCYNAKYSLAQIAMLYKDLDRAEQYFEQTLEYEDLQADSYYEISKIKLMKGQKEIAIKYINIAIDIESKRISEKIKKEPLFIPIMAKISIPFNLEEKKTKTKLNKAELVAKEHLENTTDITMNMGYINLKDVPLKEENKINEYHKKETEK